MDKIMDKYPSSSISAAMVKIYEINIKMYERCAKDDAEFKKVAGAAIAGLENIKANLGVNCGGRVGNGGPDDAQHNPDMGGIRHVGETEPERMNRVKNYLKNYRCEPLPPDIASEIDEYFSIFEQNGLAAVEWAKKVKITDSAQSGRAQSTEEQACALSLKSLENQFNAAQREIPRDSVVVRSESVLWVAAESIAKIKAQCPQLAT